MASTHDESTRRKRRRIDEDNAEETPGDIPVALPSSLMYEKSYMHRDIVLHTLVSHSTNFLITGSADGHVKFWRKMGSGVEFVKNFKAFVGAVGAMQISADGHRLVAAGTESGAGYSGILRLWDVISFDLTDFRKLPFAPGCVVWCYPKAASRALLAISDVHSSDVHILDVASGPTELPIAVMKLHAAPVSTMSYCPSTNVVVSGDGRGVLELWSPMPDTGFTPKSSAVNFRFKSETDLFAVAKCKALPTALAISADGAHFAVQSTDGHTRVFTSLSGCLLRDFDESPSALSAALAGGTLPVPLDAEDVERRIAIEHDIYSETLSAWKALTTKTATDTSPDAASSRSSIRGAVPVLPAAGGVVFDETGEILLYSCALGVKVVRVATGALLGVLGAVEATERFTRIALYQGIPKMTSQQMLARDSGALSLAVGAPGTAQPALLSDPTLLACAFRRNRFYLFTSREPDDNGQAQRDVMNEPPSAAELAALQVSATGLRKAMVADEAILHTSSGDVHVRFFPADAPKAVENFCTLARRGAYDGNLFHRVIKGFMVQGGDPRGDGTGGESCWGRPFPDEIVPARSFDRPGVLAMANAGPCTNGSQFFFTSAACTWLNGKHTIFGSVTKGMEVVRLLEGVKTGKDDRPLDDIRLLSVTIKG